jgi:hypothetical protein
MKLRDLLAATDLKKEDTGRIIGEDSRVFHQLYELSYSGEMPFCWRAAWIMDHLSALYPHLAESYIEKIWEELFMDHPVGVTRSSVRLLTRYNIPEAYEGRAADLCLEWLEKESIPPALKVYGMEILLKLTRLYPDLKNEFIAIIETQAPNNSAGFKARARQTISAMQKI